MLIKATDKNLDEIKSFCTGSILGTRIAALSECYGFRYTFFDVMLSVDENTGEISAVMSIFDGNITVHASYNFDSDELSQYLGMISFSSLIAEKDIMIKLGIDHFEERTAYRFDYGSDYIQATDGDESDYKAVYRLISENIPGSFSKDDQAYFSWLSDITFRKRRNAARIKCIKRDNRILACALTSAESDKGAIISGVACDNNSRKKGIGKSVVLTLANDLANENKDVFVIALNDSAKGFYEHIGFEKECILAIKER